MKFMTRRDMLASGSALLCNQLIGCPTQAASAALTWQTVPSFPTALPPVVASTSLASGLRLVPGSTNLFSLRFGGVEGANVPDRPVLDSYVFYNPISGNQNNVTGDDGIEGVTSCYARVRRYVQGSPIDLHRLGPAGLYLGAAAMDGSTSWRPGQVAGAMIRLGQVILPGMTIKIRIRAPEHPMSWLAIWLYGGVQVSPNLVPAARGDPYYGFGTNEALMRLPKYYGEIDIDDGFTQPDLPARSIDFGVVRKRGEEPSFLHSAPYTSFIADSRGLSCRRNNGYPFVAASAFSKSDGMHEYVLSWRNDGSNMLDYFIDGILYARQYYEFPVESYVDEKGGKRQIGMHILISNQAIPSFYDAETQEGRPITVLSASSFTGVVEEISAFLGNVADDSYSPPVNGLEKDLPVSF